MATYDKLREIARKTTPKTDGMSAAELQQAIEAISLVLRGPGVSPGERVALNEERHVYRDALSKASA